MAGGVATGEAEEDRTGRRTGTAAYRSPRDHKRVTSHAFSDVKMSRQSARLYLHYKTSRVTYCRGRLVVLKIMCRPQLSLPSGSAARIIGFHPYNTLCTSGRVVSACVPPLLRAPIVLPTDSIHPEYVQPIRIEN